MAPTETVRDDLQKPRLIMSKTTVSVVDMVPMTDGWRGAGDPVMMFLGRRGAPIFLGFCSNQQGNYNMFVVGVSGSDGSMTMDEIVPAYRGIDVRVRMIDMSRSYQSLIRFQKSTFLEFTLNTKLCTNSFTQVGTDDELDSEAEMQMFKSMIDYMASPNVPLAELQYALIREVTTIVWQDYRQGINPTHIRDYLLDDIKNESGSIGRVVYKLAKQLTPFTKGGVYEGSFNGRTNISLDADMMGLELGELRNAPELRHVISFMLTSRTAHDMYLTRDRKKLHPVDETRQLLGADKETTGFIKENYRRVRKYNDIFCVGTQGIEGAYKNDVTQVAYNNIDWKILLRRDHKNLEELIRDGTMNFSPAVRRILPSLCTERGRFSGMLISSSNDDSMVRHIPDPFSLLMASINVQDFNECSVLPEQGYSAMEALEAMLTHRAP